MTDRVRAAGVALLCAGVMAACGGERETRTDRIRTAIAAAVMPGHAAAVPGSQTGADPAADPAAELPARSGAAEDSATPDSAAEGSGERTDELSAATLTLPNGDTLTVRQAVVGFYRDRGFDPAWTGDDGLLPQGRQLLAAIGSAADDGLEPDRYHHSTALEIAGLLEEDAVEGEEKEAEYFASLDLVLTEGYLRLAHDMVNGTIDPAKTDLEWRISKSDVEDSELIHALQSSETPQAALDSLRPANHHYDLMRQALRRYRAIHDQGGWPEVPAGETLKPGDRDPRVAAVRNRLMAGEDAEEGRLAGLGLSDPILFDDNLTAALERFQARHDLHEDGAVGPNTLETLNVPVQERIDALRLNLDRWRWLPRHLGDKYIMVNVAGFEMELIAGGETIEAMNVVVGKTAHRTPIFQDTLEYMVVNPYWNVPVSIAREEILPIAMRDPGYLARNNYEVVRNGNVVSGAGLSVEALSRGYSIRQRPGPTNALGEVKFLFPNDMNIYLHDTPANHLFSQKTRAFSHGCIRVERPADLARTLLRMLSDRDPAEYDRLRAARGEQWIELDEKIPVYIFYFTTWVNDDGTVRFHGDIYERDRNLEAEAGQKLAPVERRPVAGPRVASAAG